MATRRDLLRRGRTADWTESMNPELIADLSGSCLLAGPEGLFWSQLHSQVRKGQASIPRSRSIERHTGQVNLDELRSAIFAG